MYDLAEKLTEFNETGFCLINGVLSSNECKSYKSLVKSIYPKYKKLYKTNKKPSDHGLDDKSNEELIFNLHNKDYAFVNLLDHPVSYPLVSAILKQGSFKNSEPFAYMNSAARNVLRGFKAQQLHIDSRLPASTFPLNVQVFWLLDNFTETNGSTRIVPKSHKIPKYPEYDKKYDDEIIIKAEKGSLFILNGGCWHGASEKKNNDDRWALIFTFGRWFLKPSFDFNKNMPRDIYDKMNDKQKEIMGYKFNPPIDEFTRISARSETFQEPSNYELP